MKKRINKILLFFLKNELKLGLGAFVLFFLYLNMVVIFGFSITKYFSQQEQKEQNLTDKKIQSSAEQPDGYLKVGVISDSFPPMVFFSSKPFNKDTAILAENGFYVDGTEIQLIGSIAKQMNKGIKIQPISFDSFPEALKTGKIDLFLSTVSFTDERQKNPDFKWSNAYYKPYFGILTRKENLAQPEAEKLGDLEYDTLQDFIQKTKLANLSPSDIPENLKFSSFQGSLYDQKILARIVQDGQDKIKRAENMQASVNMGVNDLKNKKIGFFTLDFDYCQYVALQDSNLKAIKLKDDKYANDIKEYKIVFSKKQKDEDINKVNEAIEKFLGPGKNLTQKTDTMAEKNIIHNDTFKKIEADMKTKEYNFFEKIFKKLPLYSKGFYNVLFLSLNGLILGCLLSIFLVKFKIFYDYKKNKFKINKLAFNFVSNLVFYIQTFLSKIIDVLIVIFRSIPIGAQGILAYYALPQILPFDINALYAALIVMTISSTVNISAIILQNIKFLNKGQIEAAYSLGMNQKQVFKFIIFQQSFKRSYASILNQFIVNLKESGVFAIIGTIELLYIARQNMSLDFDIFTPFFIISVIYLILILLTNLLIKRIEKNTQQIY